MAGAVIPRAAYFQSLRGPSRASIVVALARLVAGLVVVVLGLVAFVAPGLVVFVVAFVALVELVERLVAVPVEVDLFARTLRSRLAFVALGVVTLGRGCALELLAFL